MIGAGETPNRLGRRRGTGEQQAPVANVVEAERDENNACRRQNDPNDVDLDVGIWLRRFEFPTEELGVGDALDRQRS